MLSLHERLLLSLPTLSELFSFAVFFEKMYFFSLVFLLFTDLRIVFRKYHLTDMTVVKVFRREFNWFVVDAMLIV